MMATFCSIMVHSVESMSSCRCQLRPYTVWKGGYLHVPSGLLVENLRVVALIMEVIVTLEDG